VIHWLWYTLPLVHIPGVERVLGGPCPPVRPLPDAGRVLAVAAHPDDLEYFCGGTLCRMAQAGVRVAALLATRGELGGDPVRRRGEQEEAAAIIGYRELYQLDFHDRGVNAGDPRLRARLGEILAAERPDLLLTFDTRFPYPVYWHPDHMNVAEAALDLWWGPALLFHTRRPTAAFDITPVFEEKIAAFVAHRSQLPLRGTARLAGWHLGRRNRRGERTCLELFREHRV
jgi:LmbE family N-acetylglucosaminyl deacetylase